MEIYCPHADCSLLSSQEASRPRIYQAEPVEADCFQADTEDDDDEDCVIISTQSGESHRRNQKLWLSTFNVSFKVKTI